jgi:hypothetical protein
VTNAEEATMAVTKTPTNYSTNKRVKPAAAGAPAFGAGPKTAAGSKRIKPGDKNTTSAKFVRPPK